MATVGTEGRTALLVVDVQVGVLRTCWDAQRVIANVANSVKHARGQGFPVIWVQHFSEELIPGTPDWEWVPELQRRPGECLVAKRFNSSFEDTSLFTHLSQLGISHLVLAGAQSNWCIRATAYGALERGFDLSLVADAHTTEDTDLPDGTRIEAASVVRELNTAMSWLRYPGRRCRSVKSASLGLA